MAGITPPHPGVAIFTYAGGSHPWVLVSDRKAIVGYTFSPEERFREWFRNHDDARKLTSPPVALSDGHTAAGTDACGTIGAAICTGTNAGSGAIPSWPVRASRRQVNTKLLATWFRRTTVVTLAPGTSVSATIRIFSSLDRRRRRSAPSRISPPARHQSSA